MKKTMLSLSSTAVIVIAFLFATNDPGLAKMFKFSKPDFAINYVAAKTNNELTDIQHNASANLIRSKGDIDKIVESYSSPLSLFSKEELAMLKSNLVERKGAGIVSIQFRAIQQKLSRQDFEKLMAMFGLDIKDGFWGLSENPQVVAQVRGSSLTAMDYEGYWCSAAYTCTKASFAICTKNC